MLPKITTAIAVFGFLSVQSQAQLNVQSGATFFMQPGSQVTVQGNVDNAGTLNNDGSLRVQGNYTNTGTYTAVGTAGTLEMYGTGNANITPGTSPIANLAINKSAATDVVTLAASTTVNNGFTLTQGILTTNPTGTPAVALISPATTPYTFAAGKEVIGSVRRIGWTNGTARVFNQPNMLVTTNAGTAPTDLTVTMIPDGDPTQTEREVKRKFSFATTGGTGYTANVRYPYATSELNTNTEPGLVPWTLVATEWNARTNAITKDAGNNWVNITSIPAAELAQEWKLADQNYTINTTVYLRGAWLNGTGTLRNALNTRTLLPLSQPYTNSPYSYAGTESVASIPNTNVVDWVLIELRKPGSGLPEDANNTTIIGRKAAFILTNGTIAELDGVTPVLVPINKQGTGNFIVVRHRNHLAAMSNVKASNTAGTFTNDFSGVANVYTNPNANSAPVTILAAAGLGSTRYGLWAGDSNASGDVAPGDLTQINVAVFAGLSSIYSTRDANMDGDATGADASIANASLFAAAQTSSGKASGPAISTVPLKKVTHVPGN